MRAICWIRRDLRLSDHAALAAATEQADRVAVVFVFDQNILGALEDRDDRRLSFIQRSLLELDSALHAHGSALLVRVGDPREVIPALAREMGVDAVFTARDYEPYARERDTVVKSSLSELGVRFETVRDSVILEPGEVLTQSGTPFRVFTPFSRAWRSALNLDSDCAERQPQLQNLIPGDTIKSDDWSLSDLGFEETTTYLTAGESSGTALLQQFGAKLPNYAARRDFPADDATSHLSIHLRFGTVGIRACVRAAIAAGADGEKWLSELIWRDFYQHILFHFPDVVTHAFQPQYRDLVWPGEDAHFEAWKNGQTGYPIVDAAMRCFKETGWMHNRLRMVVASFLTKDLLIDYRRGEAHFARYLLDFDLASNNGGWQWAASTGCDAQPYFRIFNPVLQSLKFDPDGIFIRQWVPELANLTGRTLHAPWEAGLFDRVQGYPAPIVDHHVQKERAIRLLGGT